MLALKYIVPKQSSLNNTSFHHPFMDFQFFEKADYFATEQLGSRQTLTQQILPFLAIANQRKEKVVVHCSGGVGRTGHVLAAWLVSGRGYSNQQAIAAVRKTGKNPYEAAIAGILKGRNPWKSVAELNALLDDCRRIGES